MLQLPKPPWYRRWSVILAGVVVLAAASALVGWLGLRQLDGPATVSAGSSPTAATVADPVTTTRPPAVREASTTTNPDVLWERSGDDSHKGSLFEAPAKWRIVWSFDCSSFEKYRGGNFKITGEGAFARVLIQEFATAARGTQTMTASGRGRLVIDSVCERWTVRALVR